MNRYVIKLFLIALILAFPVARAEIASDELTRLEHAVSDNPRSVIEILSREDTTPDATTAAFRALLISESHSVLARGKEGLAIARQGLTFIANEKNSSLYRRLKLMEAANLDLLGQSEQALAIIDEVIKNVPPLEQPTLGREAAFYRAVVLTSLNMLPDALEILITLYANATPNAPRANKSDIANAIGNTYLGYANVDNALRFYLEAFDAAGERQRMKQNIIAYNIASCYDNKGETKQAQRFYTTSLNIAKSIGDDQGVAFVANAMATIALREGDLALASNNVKIAMEQFEKSGDKPMLANTLINAADIEVSKQNGKQAHLYLDRAEKLLTEIQLPALEQSFHLSRTEAFVAEKRYSEAYETHVKFHNATLKNMSDEDRKRVDELRVKFDSERKEQENRLLQNAKELSESKLTQETQKNFLISGVVLLLFTWVGFLVYSARKNAEIRRKLDELAYKDELTGVANRRQIMDTLIKEGDRSKRYRHPCTIALIDLDHFKQINDHYGHDIGDQVLKQFCTLCLTNLRQIDSIGRYGGEEFLIILPETALDKAIAILERLRELVAAHDFALWSDERNITISLGVTTLDNKDTSPTEALKRADEALYESKFRGRNVLAMKERTKFQFTNPDSEEKPRKYEML